MSNITNNNLISEVKNRLNNLNIDYLLFPNNLENLIIDNPTSIFPETSSTERPDKAALNILNGKIITDLQPQFRDEKVRQIPF